MFQASVTTINLSGSWLFHATKKKCSIAVIGPHAGCHVRLKKEKKKQSSRPHSQKNSNGGMTKIYFSVILTKSTRFHASAANLLIVFHLLELYPMQSQWKFAVQKNTGKQFSNPCIHTTHIETSSNLQCTFETHCNYVSKLQQVSK